MIKHTAHALTLAAVSLIITAGTASAVGPMPPTHQIADETSLDGHMWKSGFGDTKSGGPMSSGRLGDEMPAPATQRQAPENESALQQVMDHLLGVTD
ncbi:hypothetical protein [Streptomyces sp. NPDC048650]|uniref:hypothetical protein n=1 Tax=unclassified Streptomyces TaxID=2593676 RepID=UPI00371E0DB0